MDQCLGLRALILSFDTIFDCNSSDFLPNASSTIYYHSSGLSQRDIFAAPSWGISGLLCHYAPATRAYMGPSPTRGIFDTTLATFSQTHKELLINC